MPSPTTAHAPAGAGSASSAPSPPPLGTIIDDGTKAGALQLAAVLGYGGYGVVYRANSTSGGLYAVKCLLRTANQNNLKQAQRQRRLHMREIALHRLAGAGEHPGIVRLNRIIEPALPAEDGTHSIPSPYTFLVMDYAPCGDLFTLILHKQVYLGRTGLVAQVFAQLAAAVSHCHSLGIFHRDLKPENVLCWDGGATVKLADFGLATTERRSREWRTGSVYHMSPECQNGNASSPPYSPLANDIWSLAILLLNLLTARNPWARASPTDPTFAAYLNSPRNFLPQVLPISSGLNDVLVRALDVRWERRETFGVDGLAEGVAALTEEPDMNDRRRTLSFGRQRQVGMYAPDVVFEGGMARCPWEVGMHIPSGSSGSEGASQHMQIPDELVNPPAAEVKSEPEIVQRRSSSASYAPSAQTQSPSQSFMVETSDVPPTTPEKEMMPPQVNSRWSEESTGQKESPISEIRFANPSENDVLEAVSSVSSASSSEESSVGSSYSVTRTPGLTQRNVPEPRVSDADLTLNDDGEYAYAYAASPDTPINPIVEETKPPYSDVYSQQTYSPPHRARYRGRSRGRQPYPRLSPYARRDSLTRRAKLQSRKQKPELRLNVDLPAFLPMSSNNDSGTVRTDSHSRSRSRGRTMGARVRPEPVASHPFAYSVSRSASFVPGPDMDIDAERLASANQFQDEQDYDVHMISPSQVTDEEEAQDSRAEEQSTDDSASEGASVDGFSLLPSPTSATSPAEAVEDARDNAYRVDSSSASYAEGGSEGQGVVKIDRSTIATSPTDAASPQTGDFDEQYSPYQQEFNYRRSSGPSVSSSQFNAVRYDTDYNEMLDALMETDEFGAGFGHDSSRHSSETDESASSWDSNERIMSLSEQAMDMDEFDDLPGLPGSFPSSPASLRKTVRSAADESPYDNIPVIQTEEDGVEGLGLDLFTRADTPLIHSTFRAPEDVAKTYRYSAPPPSIRSATNSADAALRALHAIAVESPNVWADEIDAQSWNQVSHSRSSVSTHGAQTFMAITTDMPPVDSHVEVQKDGSANSEDFQEYTPYLRYIEDSSPARSNQSVVGPPKEVEGKSFRTEQRAELASNSTSFRGSSVQCGETPNHQSRQRTDPSPTRRRSRGRSLLKFVSRRPFSTSSAGFVPSPPPTAPPAATLNAKAVIPTEAQAVPVFPPGVTAKDNGRIIKTKSDGRGERPIAQDSAAVQPNRPRSSSSPPQQVDQPKIQQRIESPITPTPIPIHLPKSSSSRKYTSSSSHQTKSRAWSFTRSRSQTRRRSRSVSPAPPPQSSKNAPRDVFFRLRVARNWFWYALSSMTSRSSSGSVRARKSEVHHTTATPWAGAHYVAATA